MRWLIAMSAAAVLAIELVIAIAAADGPDDRAAAGSSPPPLAVGTRLDKPLGPLRLIDEHGRRTSLAAYRGRYLVLAPSLTLCGEVCPLTTGALERLRTMLHAAGMADRVAIAQATVDPWRDSPARVRAFRRRTRTDIRFLTGTRTQIRRLWAALGVDYRRVAPGDPPSRDWWTHRPERFDVTHTDGVFVIDPRGHLRVAVPGMPITAGGLPSRLSSLLDETGRRNLSHPQTPWNVEALLDDLRTLMGLPATSPAPAETTGTARPGRAGTLLDGGAKAATARLHALRGHPVVINAWASWCPPCRGELPLLAAAASRFHRQIAFLGLDVNDADSSARRFLTQHPVGYPSYADPRGTIARSLAGFVGLPTTIFLDGDGTVVSAHTGQYRDAAELERDLRRYALARR